MLEGGNVAEISWLHISDLHLKESQKWSQDVVLDSLLDAISTLEKPDLLFITGDIAFSGKIKEYELAKEFIRELLRTTSVPAERLFIIPGNHDIDRTLEEDAFLGARGKLSDPIEIDKFFANEGRRKTIFRRQEAFRNFANDMAPPDGGGYTVNSFAHSKTVNIGPINVRVLLLDSTWLAEGGDTDTGMLLIGERQVIDAHDACDGSALSFGLIHHPIAWLRDFEQTSIENLLIERVNIMLRGHVHSVDVRAVEALERRLTVFTAGATFETRTSNNTFCTGKLDLSTGTGSRVVHRYTHSDKKWYQSLPEPWRLLDKSNPTVPLSDCVAALEKIGGEFVYYRASLLAGYTTEIPRYSGATPLCVNFEKEMPDDKNLLGKIITTLRYHFYWKKVWNEEAWQAQLESVTRQCVAEMKRLGESLDNFSNFLLDQEKKSRELVFAITKGPLMAARMPVLEEIEELCKSGQQRVALQVIERWRTGGLLSIDQVKEVERVEIQILLEANSVDEALGKAILLIGSKTASAFDFFLLAHCYYAAKDYPNAGKNIHRALDQNLEIEQARKLALDIAGRTGDSALVKRVKI